MAERWAAIPGFPLYEASDKGRIRSWRTRGHSDMRSKKPRLRVQSLNHGGYFCVDMWIDGKRLGRGVHVLVALAFLGPCPEGHEVDHKNKKRGDNRLSNLRYLTQIENSRRGAKASMKTAIDMRRRYAKGEKQKDIAARYGLTQSEVSRIVNKEVWV